MSNRARTGGGRSKKRGKLAVKLSLVCAIAAFLAAALVVVLLVKTLDDGASDEAVRRAWGLGLGFAALAGVCVGITAWVQGSALAQRVTDLGLVVAKLGRGATEVRVRMSGDDEITAVGRAIQYLATDLHAMHGEQAKSGSGGGLASQDPLVRELRDSSLPDRLPEPAGWEVDGQLAAGSRGGLEHFDGVEHEGRVTLFLVAAEGASTTSAIAARMARDELVRALRTGANARKSLAHTNRVLHRELPRGVCAKACLLEFEGDEAKLYMAGFVVPALLCAAGEVSELEAEGLALGLDEGPVFEKGVRSTRLDMRPGMRLVLANDAAHRQPDFVDIVRQHSPKHTGPFMNLVLGAIEGEEAEGGLREDVVLLTAKRMG